MIYDSRSRSRSSSLTCHPYVHFRHRRHLRVIRRLYPPYGTCRFFRGGLKNKYSESPLLGDGLSNVATKLGSRNGTQKMTMVKNWTVEMGHKINMIMVKNWTVEKGTK